MSHQDNPLPLNGVRRDLKKWLITPQHAHTDEHRGIGGGVLLYVGAVPVDGMPVGGHLDHVRPGETR